MISRFHQEREIKTTQQAIYRGRRELEALEERSRYLAEAVSNAVSSNALLADMRDGARSTLDGKRRETQLLQVRV